VPSGAAIADSPIEEPIYAPISFAIPLAAGLEESAVHYIRSNGKEQVFFEEKTSTACLGTAADPKALPGHLCIYAGNESLNKEFEGTFLPVGPSNPNGLGSGAGKSGTRVCDSRVKRTTGQ
jgi:hypothetical protein